MVDSKECCTQSADMREFHGPNSEKYEDWYAAWVEEQIRLTKNLREAIAVDHQESEMKELVQKVYQHYEQYYSVKDEAAKQDVLQIMSASWRSPLEVAFLWIGGWRPTIVFQLAYSQAGQQMENQLADFLAGIDTPSLASLSSKQLQKISDAQLQTQKEEEELSKRMAMAQQGLADQPLLSLAKADCSASKSDGDAESSLEMVLDCKLEELEVLLVAADHLRLASLRRMLDILSPTQGAQYLVAASELIQAIRKVGDASRRCKKPFVFHHDESDIPL